MSRTIPVLRKQEELLITAMQGILSEISAESDRFWFLPPNMYEYEQDDRAVKEVRDRYRREIFFAKRSMNKMARLDEYDDILGLVKSLFLLVQVHYGKR